MNLSVAVLETPRLILRAFIPADEEPLAAMMGDPEVMRLYGGGVTLSGEGVRGAMNYHLHCREHDYWAWAITARDDGRFIGSLTAGMTEFEGASWFEPAWILVHKEWGQGYATEAAKAVVGHALNDLGMKRLLATADRRNQASIRVIEKAGFTFLREAEVRLGRPAEVFVLPRPD